MRQIGKRGFSLAFVLTLGALGLLLVGLAMDSSLKLHARERHRRNREQAILYAKNGLERALVKLANPDWGKQPSDELTVGPLAGHPADAGARITFDPADPLASVNNFDRDGTSEVPKNTVHLWSVGSYGGVKVRLEASVARPRFPYAIASSGPITTSGAFFAGTIEDPADADLPFGSTEFMKKVKQASLLSNGTSTSLRGAPVHITGDLISAGEISLDPQVRVDGQVRSHSEVKPIPKFELTSFDTAGKPLLDEIPPGDLRRDSAIKGYARCDGNLRVSGPLKLEEAILYVNGDLRVDGQLSGKGALFVRGNVVVESTSLGALDEVALIAGGSLRVSGSGQNRSKLVGLLVSCGDLSLSDVTVVGAVVCTGDSTRTLTMENVNVFGSPKGLQFEFAVGWGVDTSYEVKGFGRGGTVLVRLKQLDDPSAPGGKRDAKPADFVGRYDVAHPDSPLLRESDFEVVLANGSVTTLSAAGILFDDDLLQFHLTDKLDSVAVKEAGALGKSGFSQGKLSLDLNRFLRLGDTLQVVYRRIH